MRAVLDEHGDCSGGRAGDDLAFTHDRLRHGVERHRLGEPRAQRVEPVRPRCERTVFCFALAQRFFDPLPFSQLVISSGTVRLQLRTSPLRALEAGRLVERLRRPIGQLFAKPSKGQTQQHRRGHHGRKHHE